MNHKSSNKISRFVAVMALSAAVALGAAGLTAANADACGAYGPPTAEQQVTRAAWAALHDNFVDRASKLTVRVAGDMATARAEVDRGGRTLIRHLAFLEIDGAWVLAGSVDRPVQSPASVGARSSSVRKTF